MQRSRSRRRSCPPCSGWWISWHAARACNGWKLRLRWRQGGSRGRFQHADASHAPGAGGSVHVVGCLKYWQPWGWARHDGGGTGRDGAAATVDTDMWTAPGPQAVPLPQQPTPAYQSLAQVEPAYQRLA